MLFDNILHIEISAVRNRPQCMCVCVYLKRMVEWSERGREKTKERPSEREREEWIRTLEEGRKGEIFAYVNTAAIESRRESKSDSLLETQYAA